MTAQKTDPLEKLQLLYAKLEKQNRERGLHDSTYTRLQKGLAAFCESEGIPATHAWTKGLAKFVATAEGRALKSAYDANPEMPHDGAAVEPEAFAPATTTKSAYDELAEGLTAFCAARKITKVWTDGLDAFRKTADGARLEAAYREEA